MGNDCSDSPFEDLILSDFSFGNFFGGIENVGFGGLKIGFLVEGEKGLEMR